MTRRKRPRKPKPRKASPTQTVPARPENSDRLRPWFLGAAMALLVARPLYPSESAANEGDGLPVVMLWIVLGLFWLIASVTKPRFRVRFGGLELCVVLLIGWHTLSAIVAMQSGAARPALNMLWEWIALGLSFLLFRQWIQKGAEVRAVLVVMMALAVSLSGYGFYQYAIEMPATRAMYQNNPDQALQDAGLWFEPGSVERQAFEQRLASTEPTTTFALTNSLAGYLVPWLTVLLGIGFACLKKNTQQAKKLKVVVAICVVTVAGCLLLTKSRSGYLAATLGLVLVGLSYRASRQKTPGQWKLIGALITTVILLAIGAVAIGGLDRQVISEASKSFGYRVQYWQSSLRMIADHPILGCGPGQFQNAYPHYKLPEASEEIADPHNFLLEVWATAGTPAMLALVMVLGVFFSITFKRHSGGNMPPDNPAASTKSLDAVFPILGGGLVGMLLSVPLGLFSTAPPGLTVLGMVPLALIVTISLFPWIRAGEMPDILPAIGLVVLLVNLLAAGGIGFPSVAGSLWLLLVVGLVMVESRSERSLPPRVGLILLATMFFLGFFCYTTGYRPVMQARAAIHATLNDRSRAEEYLTEACQADPWAAGSWKHLSGVLFERWSQTADQDVFQAFEACLERAHQLDPNSSAFWYQSGIWYDQAFEQSGDSVLVEKAVASYRRAVHFYPTRALFRARLAIALRNQGDKTGFRLEAEEAFRLDEQTPHTDKKLPDELRNTLMRSMLRTR